MTSQNYFADSPVYDPGSVGRVTVEAPADVRDAWITVCLRLRAVDGGEDRNPDAILEPGHNRCHDRIRRSTHRPRTAAQRKRDTRQRITRLRSAPEEEADDGCNDDQKDDTTTGAPACRIPVGILGPRCCCITVRLNEIHITGSLILVPAQCRLEQRDRWRGSGCGPCPRPGRIQLRSVIACGGWPDVPSRLAGSR